MNTKTLLILTAVALMVLLLIHHHYVHRNDDTKTILQKWFEWEDINNHETVIMLLLGFALGLLVSLYL